MRSKRPIIDSLPPLQRRGFAKLLAAAVAAPALAPGLRHAVNALAFGEAKAEEMDSPPILFIEIDLRDQWDFGHVFVAPGLATFANLKRGSSGDQCAMFFTPDQLAPRNDRIYLTPLSLPLEPHLDTIAMIETCELGIGDIHGHEASNPQRSPGRTNAAKPGYLEMGANELGLGGVPGNQVHYSTTPTPAALHNYWMKQLDPAVRNGVAFKGISREHTAYHFSAGLPGGELDRLQTRAQLFAAFPDKLEDYNTLPTPEQAAALAEILRRADDRFLQRLEYTEAAQLAHHSTIDELPGRLYVGVPKLVSIPLDEPETAYWSAGVPPQVGAGNKKAEIWEMVGWAHKLIANGLVRTVALEFDYLDWHDYRDQALMDTLALQTVLPLARLIESLKLAGLYDRTLIAVYTLDSGRSPAAYSSGNIGKSGLMLAGGMIKGGYYGDVGVAGDQGDGHVYSFSMPDIATGAPLPGVTDNSQRMPGAPVWKTVMKALQIPDEVADSFPDVAGAPHLPWMLRA
jgi:hypothetical protein